MECLNPKGIANPREGISMRVRCGKCPPCQKFRAQSWVIRLIEQEKCTKNNYFMTLTLNDENITWGYDRPTLNKRDVQLFFKKFRKNLDNRIKYYAVGEYGENTKRPHYHVILFNSGIDSPEVLKNLVYTSWTDSQGQNKGYCHVGTVTDNSIKYVAGYMEKGPDGDAINETIQREFNLMSKGIGENYLNSNKKYHKENEKFTYRIGAKDAPLPRYYRDRIFSEQERQAYASKVAESIPKRSPHQEECHREAIKNRVNSIQKLKKARK